MRNYPEWVISYWATISLGAAVVGMNAWWTGPEMEFGLADCGARALICDSERLDRVKPLLAGLRDGGRRHVIVVRSDGDLPTTRCTGRRPLPQQPIFRHLPMSRSIPRTMSASSTPPARPVAQRVPP